MASELDLLPARLCRVWCSVLVSVGAWVHVGMPDAGSAVFRLTLESSQICSSHCKAVSLTLLMFPNLCHSQVQNRRQVSIQQPIMDFPHQGCDFAFLCKPE